MNMNLLRSSLIGGILVVTFLLFIRWSEFQEEKHALEQLPEETLSSQVETPASEFPTSTSISTESESESDDDIPQAPAESGYQETPSLPVSKSALIKVKTDTLDVVIDTHGGDIVRVALPKYLVKQDEPDNPFIMLRRTESHTYVAQSGLVGPNGTDKTGQRPIFVTSSSFYEMKDSEDTLSVDLIYLQDQTQITKRFTFNRESYVIEIDYLIDNQSSEPWTATFFGQIRRDSFKPSSDIIGMQPFVGAAITTPESNYKKLSFGDLEDKPFKVENQGGWVAMIQHYFVSAWIPNPEQNNHYHLRKSRGKDIYLLGFTGKSTTVAANSTGSLNASFYVGPKIIKELEKIAPHLDLTIDYSWLWFIAKPLFYGLDTIQDFVGNWGLAIILLTLVIKLIFFYPSAMSYKSMAKMRKLAPMMNDLKERFGDDRQKMSAELMKMYRKEKVNPLGGCLPILMQMPVFIALYWVLMESVELRHSPFFFWIEDLSVKDPFFILPLIMGATMYIQQKLNPTPPDPMQAKIMQMMPIFFTFLFLMFPAGLVLYWVVNNTLSIAQQYAITRKIEKEDS